MRELAVATGGPGGPMGGFYVWSAEIGYGCAYSDPEDRYGAIARLLDEGERRLGVPLVLGTLTERIVNNTQDDERDMFGHALPEQPKPKRRRHTRYTDTAEQERWY